MDDDGWMDQMQEGIGEMRIERENRVWGNFEGFGGDLA